MRIAWIVTAVFCVGIFTPFGQPIMVALGYVGSIILLPLAGAFMSEGKTFGWVIPILIGLPILLAGGLASILLRRPNQKIHLALMSLAGFLSTVLAATLMPPRF